MSVANFGCLRHSQFPRPKIWEHIKELKEERGVTLLLTTHYMDEAEQLSDYVYIIDNGKIVREGRPEDLIRELGDDTVRLSGEAMRIRLNPTLASRTMCKR